MRYYGILRERKTWVKAVLLLLAVCMLLLEIARKQWIYVPVMLLVGIGSAAAIISLSFMFCTLIGDLLGLLLVLRFDALQLLLAEK